MRSFIVKLRLLLGEYEKGSVHLIKAKTRADAEARAISMESHNNPIDRGNGRWEDGDFIYRIASVKEISPLTFEYLQEYIE